MFALLSILIQFNFNSPVLVELQQMLEKEDKTLLDFDPQPLDHIPYLPNVAVDASVASPQLSAPRGSASGGYTENIFMYASQHLFGITPDNLEYKSVRYSFATLYTRNIICSSALLILQKPGFARINIGEGWDGALTFCSC